MTKITLAKNEEIIAVNCVYSSGPGWANSPVTVHIVNYANNKHRCEYIQPEKQTTAIHALFRAANAVQSELKHEVVNNYVKNVKITACNLK